MEKHTLNTPTGVFTLPGRPPQMAKHYEVGFFFTKSLNLVPSRLWNNLYGSILPDSSLTNNHATWKGRGGGIGHCCNLCLPAHPGTFSGFTRMNTARETSLNHYRFKWSHNKHLSSQLYQEYKQQQQQLSCHFGWQSPPLIKFQSQLPQNKHIWSVRDNIRKVKWLTHNRIYENVCFVRLL